MNATQTTLKPTMETTAAAIAYRCQRDSGFRAKFLAHPKETVEEIAGKKLAKQLNIVVHRNSNSQWHLPVPDYSNVQEAATLSDPELEKITAAGELWVTTSVLVGITTATVITGVVTGIVAGVAATGFTIAAKQ